MNPEFRRQLWLNVSVGRVVALPFVLTLLFILIGVTNDWKRDSIAYWALCIGSTCSALLGGAAAVESLAIEARGRTWDWQRLSGVGAWNMTWGKLFGSTLLANCGAMLAYAVFLVVGGATRPNTTYPLLIVALGVSLGVLVQSVGLLVAAAQIASDRRQAPPAASYVLGAGATGLMVITLVMVADRIVVENEHWYGTLHSLPVLLLITAIVFAGWIVFGAYRLLRTELEGRSAPWFALAFAVFAAFYVAGLVNASFMDVRGIASMRLVVAELVIAGFTYVVCFWDRMRAVDLERWLLALRSDRTRAWAQTPTWIACLALAVFACISIAVLTGIVIEQSGSAAAISVALALIIVRDAGLLFALRLRGGSLTSDAWLLVFVICIHIVVPAIGSQTDAKLFREFFSLAPKQSWLAVPILICEILLVVQWLRSLRQQKAIDC
jgi:hypothetical protein